MGEQSTREKHFHSMLPCCVSWSTGRASDQEELGCHWQTARRIYANNFCLRDRKMVLNSTWVEHGRGSSIACVAFNRLW